jgi:hypothetical protein
MIRHLAIIVIVAACIAGIGKLIAGDRAPIAPNPDAQTIEDARIKSASDEADRQISQVNKALADSRARERSLEQQLKEADAKHKQIIAASQDMAVRHQQDTLTITGLKAELLKHNTCPEPDHSACKAEIAALQKQIADLKAPKAAPAKRRLMVVRQTECKPCDRFEAVLADCSDDLAKDYKVEVKNCDHEDIPFSFHRTPSVAVLDPDAGTWCESWNPSMSASGFLNDLYVRSGGKRGKKAK